MKKGRLQKLAGLFLCAALVFAFNAQALSVVTEAPAGLSVDNATPAPGGIFTVTVSFPAMAEQFDAADLRVHFDTDLVEATEVTATLIAGAVPFDEALQQEAEAAFCSTAAEANANGFFSVCYFAFPDGDPVDFPGLTLTATFQLKDGVTAGTEITFEADEDYFYVCRFNASSFEDIDLTPSDTVRSVTVTVTDEPAFAPGDVNGDGEIDDNDVEYLLFYTLFPEDYPLAQDEADCDFNGDDVVDDGDVEYLLFYTLFPEDYPLN